MTAPSALRCLTLVTVAAATAALLVAAPGAAWPPTRPEALLRWWESVGTAHAAAVIVRLVGLGIAGWAALLGGIGLGAALWPARLLTLWSHVGRGRVRRLLTAGLVATVVAAASPAGADDAPPPLVLVDLGPVAAPASPLVDLGPVSTNAESPPEPFSPEAGRATSPPRAASTGADRWVVARGDHLWAVAEATLAARGIPADDAATARYWADLIAANRTVVGEDPDLIHPGDVLVLPPVEGVRGGS